MQLVLASNSPRRKQLLNVSGWEFLVLPAEIDERTLPGESPLAYVLRLAEGKARLAAGRAPQGAWIVAADTTVVDRTAQGEVILGKPADAAEAEAMLRRLRGRTHLVYTGLAVYRPQDDTLLTDWCATAVPMRPYTDAEMLAYIASGDPFDKAGAYAIQHAGFSPVEKLDGCYANVMGLPLCHLTRTLGRLGAQPLTDVPAGCQALLDFECPVFNQVLHNEV
jgi:septum formation protein